MRETVAARVDSALRQRSLRRSGSVQYGWLHDWLALRIGRIGAVAVAVTSPQTHAEVAAALTFAQRLGAQVVPYDGGTSVVGHRGIPARDRPLVNISLEAMHRHLAFDRSSRRATFGAGTPGPQVEAHCSGTFHSPMNIRPSVAGW